LFTCRVVRLEFGWEDFSGGSMFGLTDDVKPSHVTWPWRVGYHGNADESCLCHALCSSP